MLTPEPRLYQHVTVYCMLGGPAAFSYILVYNNVATLKSQRATQRRRVNSSPSPEVE